MDFTDQQFVLIEDANQLIHSIENLRSELAQKNQIIDELQQCIHHLTRSNTQFPLPHVARIASQSNSHNSPPRQQRNGLVRSASIMSSIPFA